MTIRKLVSTLVFGALAGLLLSDSDCSNPTEPRLQCLDQTSLFEAEAFYQQRSESPVSWPGRLTKNCQAGGRNHCYFLGPLPVYAASKEAVLDRFVGQDVLIVGKPVDLATGSELWPGTICRFNIQR